jgi:hypothetical protein
MTNDFMALVEIVDGQPRPDHNRIDIGKCPQIKCDGILVCQYSATDFVFDTGLENKIVDMGKGSKHLYKCFKCEKHVFTNWIINHEERIK